MALPYAGAVVCNCSQTRVANNRISGFAIPLTATAATGQGLGNGNYLWVVTALDAAGREIVVTAPATLAVTGTAVQLSWAQVLGVTSYNVYRTAVNVTSLQFDGNVPQGSGPTITYTDTVPDSGLTGAFPAVQNDGIVLGSASFSLLVGTQIIGNQISNLVGTGIVSPGKTLLTATLIDQNQIANLGGNGIVLSQKTAAIDLEITGNLIATVGQLPIGVVAGIALEGPVIFADLSSNNVENVGPQTGAVTAACAGTFLGAAADVRLAGNRIVNIAPVATASAIGVGAILGPGRSDFADNEVRRQVTPPSGQDESSFLALVVAGDSTTNVQGNSLESFGGLGNLPGTVLIGIDQPCTFSNNQCFLDGANERQFVVVGITAQSLILMGNFVQGPADSQPSVDLTISATLRPLTAVGNITSAGINLNGAALPDPWAPLNI